MKKVIISAFVLAAAVGCAKQNNEVAPDGLNEIRLGSAIAGQVSTKAAYDGDVAISDLQFLRVDGSVSPTDFSSATAIVGSRAAGGAITFQNTQRYLASGNTYFASYVPAGSVNNGVVTWAIDGKTDIMTAAVIDAGSQASHATPGALAYEHKLTQVEVICKAEGDGGDVQTRWGNITSIKMRNTPTSVSYAYNGLAVTPSAALGKVALVKPGYADAFEPIEVPASTNVTANAVGMFVPVASQNFTLEVTTATAGSKVVTIVLGAGDQLLAATRNVVTLTFKPSAEQDEIAVTSTVQAWSTGATGSGNLN